MSSQLKVNAISDAAGANGNAITLATDGTCTAKITNNLSNRNLIINGAMQVNQRQSTAGLDDFNVVTGNLYTLDRWEGTGTSSFDWDSARIKQVSDSPDEFSNSLRVDIGNTETPGAGQNGVVRTKIEAQNLQHLAYGTSSAKSCTLSFWVRSNKTGTYCVQIQHRDNDKYVLYEYSISSANTWEKKTITFAGNTSGVIDNNNEVGFSIVFHLACHSDDHVSATTSWTANNSGKLYATSNQVNLWDHADNVWYLTGVQLEVGDTATDFEHRSYGDELARCQRYFQFIGSGAVFPARGASSSDYLYSYITPVSLRASPTVATSNDLAHGTFSVRRYRDGSGTSDSTNTPTTSSSYFQGNANTIYLAQGGFSATDDRSATIFISGGAITLSSEL